MIEQNSKEEKGRETKKKEKSNADVSAKTVKSLSINIKKDNKSIREKYVDAYYSDNFLESIF